MVFVPGRCGNWNRTLDFYCFIVDANLINFMSRSIPDFNRVLMYIYILLYVCACLCVFEWSKSQFHFFPHRNIEITCCFSTSTFSCCFFNDHHFQRKERFLMNINRLILWERERKVSFDFWFWYETLISATLVVVFSLSSSSSSSSIIFSLIFLVSFIFHISFELLFPELHMLVGNNSQSSGFS